MEFEDIGRVWREEATGQLLRTRVESLLTVRDRAAELDASIRRRDRREAILGAFVILLFFVIAYILLRSDVLGRYPLAALGVGMVLVSGAASLVRRHRARTPMPDRSLAVREALEIEVGRLRSQERFLASIVLWHSIPLGLGALLFVIALPVPSVGKLIYAVVVVSFVVFAHVHHTRSAETEFKPLRRELESWLDDLSRFEHESPP